MKKTTKADKAPDETQPEDAIAKLEASTEFLDRLGAAAEEVGEAQNEYLEFAKGDREWGDDILEKKDDAMNSMIAVLGEIFPGLTPEVDDSPGIIDSDSHKVTIQEGEDTDA